ncbi:MAG: PQQ-like beta-propeller repeat protein [Melioribacteraceae bacterium]|jgi:outer membrane protein assembly factor BamB|nr:PQQ-like beta-propeller repeat protein [Melioribacteraceae bacterium]
MKKSVFYLLFLCVTTFFQAQWKEVESIESDNFIYPNNIILQKDGTKYLALFTYIKPKITLLIYDKNKKIIFSEKEIDYTYDDLQDTLNNIYFLKKNRLYEFSAPNILRQIGNFHIDYENLDRPWIDKTDEQFTLTLNYRDRIEIIDLKSQKNILNYKRKVSIKYPTHRIVDDKVFIQSDENLLVCYSLKLNKVIWEMDFGITSYYYLGIKLGEGKDDLSKIYGTKKSNEIIVITRGGNLYKIDSNTGTILMQKKKIGGNDNNAGMIGYLRFYDFNNDGVDDIIGGSVDFNIYGIDGKTFNILWKTNTGNEIQLPLTLHNINKDNTPEVITITDYDANVIILDIKSGEIKFNNTVKQQKKNCQSVVTFTDFFNKGTEQLIVRTKNTKISFYEFK